MKRLIEYCLFTCAVVLFSLPQAVALATHGIFSAATVVMQDAAAARQPEIRGTFPATLVKSLDSRKLKEGDSVICVTAAVLHARSGLMIPSGSKVIGHVTQATARSNGNPDSTLAIAFDKIEFSKEEELPIQGILQAVAASLGNSEPNTGPAEPGSLGGAARGNSSSPGTTPGPTSSVQISGPTKGTSILSATSQGVLGVKNLQLDANGVLTSTGKEVKLDSGMQLLVRAEVETPAR